jgi:hypothetical protein
VEKAEKKVEKKRKREVEKALRDEDPAHFSSKFGRQERENPEDLRIRMQGGQVNSIVSRTAYCSLTLSLLLLLQGEEDVVVGSARSGDSSAAVAEAEAAYNSSTGASGMGQPMVPLRCAYTVCY